jgi:hypothetical protein
MVSAAGVVETPRPMPLLDDETTHVGGATIAVENVRVQDVTTPVPTVTAPTLFVLVELMDGLVPHELTTGRPS